MKLSLDQVDHIAKLARLNLLEEERDAFQKQLSSILEYVEKLSGADTANVEPMSHSLELHNVWRDDEVHPCADDVRNRCVGSFPEKSDDLLKVQSVF